MSPEVAIPFDQSPAVSQEAAFGYVQHPAPALVLPAKDLNSVYITESQSPVSTGILCSLLFKS